MFVLWCLLYVGTSSQIYKTACFIIRVSCCLLVNELETPTTIPTTKKVDIKALFFTAQPIVLRSVKSFKMQQI